MIEVNVEKVGSGLGVQLPQEVLTQLGAVEGQAIYLEDMFDGSYRLAKHDDEYLKNMALVDGQMHEEDA